MLETVENLLPYIPEDMCTRSTRGCCQHDEPLPHSCNSQNKEYDHLEDGKRSINFNFGKMPLHFRSKRLHSKGPVRSKASNSAGLRQRSRNYHIEGLRKSETLHYAGPRKSDNSYSYRTKGLQGSKTLQDESRKRFNTLHSVGLQTSGGLHSHSSNDSTRPHFDCTRGINSFCQNALQTFILKISMSLIIARKYPHVVILSMVFLTRVACEDVPINCTSAAVITSRNYPSTYPPHESKDWSVTAPGGRIILLTFNNFSLGPLGEVKVIDTLDNREGQSYGEKEKPFPPFLSRRNSFLLRFTSAGTPTGNGFNISASCYDISGTRVGRLVGGKTLAEGFLELQAEAGGEWMRVCEDPSADRVAEVVCRELGFPGVKEVSNEHLGCSGANRKCIRAPSCENYAYRSQDCSSSEKCASSLAAAVKVKCFEPGFKGCYDLGNAQLQNGSSYNSTSQCVTSCRADTSQAIAIINGSKCFCSTTDDIGLSSFSPVEARSCAPHQLVYNASVGFCNQMDHAVNGYWEFDTTWFGSIVHLKCDEGYSLKGNGTLQCVTEVSTHIHIWNDSIPTCEVVNDPSYPMTSGQGNAAIAILPSMTALLTAFLSALLICSISAVV